MTLSEFKDKAEEIVKQYIPEDEYRNLRISVGHSLDSFDFNISIYVYSKSIRSNLCKSPEEALEVFRINMETEHNLRLAKEEFKDKLVEDMEISSEQTRVD